MKDVEGTIEQYTPMISALMRKLHIYRDYESFQQVAKIALWQAWLRFDEAKGDFTPYAYRSMQGAMLDELKRESRFTEFADSCGNEKFERIEDIRKDDELPDWLDDVLLKENERQLLEDLFVKGLHLSQIAEQQGLSLSGMKKRRERVLKKVKAVKEL